MKPIQTFANVCGNILLIFEHGLGDLINFIPVYEELCRQLDRTNIRIGSSKKRQFHLIHRHCLSLEDISTTGMKRQFEYIYRVNYPDSVNSVPPIELHHESAKPYLCAYYELGMDEFAWKPFNMKGADNKNSKRIGVHLFGHTGMDRKFCPKKNAELIWNEIIEAGYEPYEVHMVPQFINEYRMLNSKNVSSDTNLSMINQNNSLRFEEPNLSRMIEEINKCKYFIGIDSGPIYLASAILGCDNIVGLYNLKRHDHFLPRHISMVNVNNYKRGSIKRIIKQRETW